MNIRTKINNKLKKEIEIEKKYMVNKIKIK